MSRTSRRSKIKEILSKPGAIKEILNLIDAERFINAKKLAKRLGISSKLAGAILKDLRDMGLVAVWNDRKGKKKIYCSVKVIRTAE